MLRGQTPIDRIRSIVVWQTFKGALSCYSVILCRFFAFENGGEEIRGRGAGQWEACPCNTFFLHQFRASQSIDVGVSISYPCKVIPLSDEDGLWDKIKKVKTKRQVCPWKWGKFVETETGLRSSTDRSWAVLVRRSFKPREAFRCSCVYFATQYNVHYDNRQAEHLLSALRLERCTAAIIFPHNEWRKKITE